MATDFTAGGKKINPVDAEPAYGRLFTGNTQADLDKTPEKVLLEKVSNIERIVEFLYKRELSGVRPPDMGYPMKEPVYEIYIGGKSTGIQGTRSDLENRVVAVAPAETVPLKSMEEFVKQIPLNPNVIYATQEQNY